MSPETLTPDTMSISEKIFRIGNDLKSLDTGPLADLRRMDLAKGDITAPYVWRLAARYNLPTDKDSRWPHILQLMAILTDKGPPDHDKPSPHLRATKDNQATSLGRVLCDGGDPEWERYEQKPKPVLSEARFARLLAARGATRRALLYHAVRVLAARKPAGAAIDCVQLAYVALSKDPKISNHQLARDYYARLDREEYDTKHTDEAPIGDRA